MCSSGTSGKSGYCTGLVVVIALGSILLLLGKGIHKGGQKLTGKEFCQNKYEECMGRHPYLLRTGLNTKEFCERQIFRNYYCKTRLPGQDKNVTVKPLRDRSLGGGDEEPSDSIPTEPNRMMMEFYIEVPLHSEASNSTQEVPDENYSL